MEGLQTEIEKSSLNARLTNRLATVTDCPQKSGTIFSLKLERHIQSVCPKSSLSPEIGVFSGRNDPLRIRACLSII